MIFTVLIDRKLFYGIFGLEVAATLTGVMEAYYVLVLTTPRNSILEVYVAESVNRVVNMVFVFVPLRMGVGDGSTGLALAAIGFTLSAGVSLAIIRKVRTAF